MSDGGIPIKHSRCLSDDRIGRVGQQNTKCRDIEMLEEGIGLGKVVEYMFRSMVGI
jgi:hypothetical protein